MALPARPIHVPAGLPIDESARKELLDVGATNVSNVNVRADKRGGLNKRLGFGSLPVTRLDATSRTAGRRMFVHGQQTCVIDGTYIDVFRQHPDGSSHVNITRGRVPEAALSCRAIASPGASPSSVEDCASVNGEQYLATAYVVDGRAWAALESAAEGELLVAPQNVAAASAVALGSYGNIALLFLVTSGNANVVMYKLDTTSSSTINAGWTLVGNVGTDHHTGGSITVSTESLTDRVAVAWTNNSGGASQLTVKTCNATGVLQSTTINTNTVAPEVVAVAGSSTDTLWVAWNEDFIVRICGLNPTSITSALATTVTILNLSAGSPTSLGVVASVTAGKARVLCGDGNTDRMQMRGVQTSAGAAATDGSQITVYAATPLSRPVRIGTRYYALFGDRHAEGPTSDNPQDVAILCDFTDDVSYLRPVANPFPYLARTAGTERRARFLSLNGKYSIPINVVRSAAARATYLIEFDFSARRRWQAVQHAGATFLGGGLTSYFDGQRVAEVGFLVRPDKPSGSGAGTGITGTFKAVAIYEEVDSAGNWWLSGVSTPSNSVNVTNNTITWRTTPLSITARQVATTNSRVRVVFYRTLTGGEPPYYRLGEVANDTSVDEVSFSDAVTDATLATYPLLYGTGHLPGTNGAAQDRRAPPGLAYLVSYNGMLVGAEGENLWYSGQDVSGEGTWFNPIFQVPASGGGSITGLATQDGTLYVFKRRAIFAVAGEPPSDNGAAGGLGTPRRLAADVGCIDASSIVVCSSGVFFQSERGIELLTRSGEVVFVGEKVQDTLASYPVVSSAVLDDRNGLVRFSLAASESSGAVSGNGRDLIFDLTIGAWISVDDKRGSGASEASQDACMVYYASEWRYAWLGTSGVIYYERLTDDASAYLDGASWVTAQYELPPWKLGLSQEQRIYEMEALVERHSAAGLTIEVANDLAAYGSDDKVWAEAATSGQRRLPFRPKPLSSSVSLRVKDTAPAVLGTGRGFTFIGLSADIAPKQGPTRGTPRLDTGLRR